MPDVFGQILTPAKPQRTIAEWLPTTWPARMAQSLASAITLPRDVMRDPSLGREILGGARAMSDETFERATNLAQVPMVATSGAPPGALGAGFVVDYFGTPVRVLENPSPQALTGFLNRTKYKAARRIVDQETKATYVWDAADPAMHRMMADHLGVPWSRAVSDTIGID